MINSLSSGIDDDMCVYPRDKLRLLSHQMFGKEHSFGILANSLLLLRFSDSVLHLIREVKHGQHNDEVVKTT